MKRSIESPEWQSGFGEGQMISLAGTEAMIEQIELLEARVSKQSEIIRMLERDNSSMDNELQRARTLAEQAGAQEGRFALADPPPAETQNDGRLALFVILVLAVGIIVVGAWAGWTR